jgi:hypothetical protein
MDQEQETLKPMNRPRLTHSLSSIQRAEADGRRPPGFTKVCLDHASYDRSTELVKFTIEGWLVVNQWVRTQPIPGTATVSVAPKGVPPFGFGDAVAAIATPIARALHMPCIDPATGQLRPDSDCQKRKTSLNKIHF